MNLSSPISQIKGVGKKTEQYCHNLGVYTCGDILLHYPRGYRTLPEAWTLESLLTRAKEPSFFATEKTPQKRQGKNRTTLPSEEKEGSASYVSRKKVALLLKITQLPILRTTPRMQVTSLSATCSAGSLSLVWFRMPYLKNTLNVGNTFVFLGNLQWKNRRFVMEQPEIFLPEKYAAMENRAWPCYDLTRGLSQNAMAGLVAKTLSDMEFEPDPFPEAFRKTYSLMEQSNAFYNIHFPKQELALEEARRRLIFEEFFYFILTARLQKEKSLGEKNIFSFSPMKEEAFLSAKSEPSCVEALLRRLPFSLTGAQQRVLKEIRLGLRGEVLMHRLIQGDVGSGKTILAFLAMADCAFAGYQAALMAPTEVLARQHYENLLRFRDAQGLSVPVVLLTGSQSVKERSEALEMLTLDPNAWIVGTHALIQEKVIFPNLALVITDEQHRFGVHQRELLAEKGGNPHVLVMSATPIPRTLAMILYSDMELSVLDEVPAKRLPIKNCVVRPAFRNKTYAFLLEEIQKGHQAYVLDYARILQEYAPDLSIGVLHGKLPAKEKNRIMDAFLQNEIRLLVSTTVVEVGVDVPNATVMLIEDAQRFGLAQLHQLRGRIGRGEAQSYCIFLNTSDSKPAEKRLSVINSSTDGFYIAAEDLKLRGPGDFFGVRQKGLFSFALADIYRDAELLSLAQKAVEQLMAEDPFQEREAYQDIYRNCRSQFDKMIL